MYWDVVEVKPEPGHRLFIRFKDGLSGLVRLAEEELTGALAPLRDEDFFRQVFILWATASERRPRPELSPQNP